MSESTRAHPSALLLDAIALGAAVPDEARVRSHIDRCDRCREDLAARRAEAERFRTSVLPRTWPVIHSRAGRAGRPWQRLRPLYVLLPAAAALLLWWTTRPRPDDLAADPGRPVPAAPGSAGIAVKGAPALRVFAMHGGAVIAVHDGTVLTPADRIRFAVAPEGFPYLLVASVDGSGSATIYHPYGGDRSARLEPAALVELPGSIVLDHARGPERVYALFSRAAIPASQVLERLRAVGAGGAAAIRAATRLEVTADHQASILFEKAP